jgi:hypothetical protein
MSHISQLPIPAQLRFVRDAWEREKKMRSTVLHGNNRVVKIEEANQCIEALDNIAQHFVTIKRQLETAREPVEKA